MGLRDGGLILQEMREIRDIPAELVRDSGIFSRVSERDCGHTVLPEVVRDWDILP